MKIAITGATGFVGSRLVEKLKNDGHQLLIFTRNANRAQQLYPASRFPNLEIISYQPMESGDWQKAISGCEAVVNLAGEPIVERWTSENRKAILESRQLGTRKIVEAIAQAETKLSVLVNASAVGYYGTSEISIFDEDSDPGDDFLSQVCQVWETEANEVKQAGVRLVILRIGIVLGDGGVLAKIIPPFKLFVGGPLGKGNQWFSWIHLDDLVNLIIESLERNDVEGTFNATSPHPVRMSKLCKTLGEIMNRPSWLPVPDFVLKFLLGDASKIVLEGQQVLPKRTKSIGFKYQYPNLKKALMDILH
ncbi:putative YfcH-like cell division inhibitor [cyanobacterium endosymbiont of Rhopalodia gibberula]|uniref:thylakoid membrane protein ThyD n=1 Tax=cyanobacterium endosymbiont of Rhopalodia gibberula TaxID=1763363 RepID=UPI000DC73B87|nr:TIGR01777 family oxidoreductase [cyanobacterium endosymbiont of Rhopalodia gibberula]BBA79844.1 putative YfcH-like cell division inhibitor [cyanobacterium endosymbiont of Rhopalodia gibberula]